jgi:hypothetical protein
MLTSSNSHRSGLRFNLSQQALHDAVPIILEGFQKQVCVVCRGKSEAMMLRCYSSKFYALLYNCHRSGLDLECSLTYKNLVRGGGYLATIF